MKRIKFSLNNINNNEINLKNWNKGNKIKKTKSVVNPINIKNIKHFSFKKSILNNKNSMPKKLNNKNSERINNKNKIKFNFVDTPKVNKNKFIHYHYKKSKKKKQFSIYILPLIYQFKKNIAKVIQIKKNRKSNEMTTKEYKISKKIEKLKEFCKSFIINYKYILNNFKNNSQKRDDYLINVISSYTYNKDEIFSFFFSKKNVLNKINKDKIMKFILNNDNQNIRKEITYDLKKLENKFKEEILRVKNKNFKKSFSHLKNTLKNIKINKIFDKKKYGYLNNNLIKNPFIINDNNNIKRKMNYLSDRI